MQLYHRVLITADVPAYQIQAGTQGTWVDIAKGKGGIQGWIIELPTGHPGGIVAIVSPDVIKPAPVKSAKRKSG